VDAVERQLTAYNARNADAFAGCYARDVVIEDLDGEVVMRGRDEVRRLYGALFESHPGLHAEVRSRIRIGQWVVDEERVEGLADDEVHAVAIYRLAKDGLIERVRFLHGS
jgi:hypothetical protein